MLQKRKNPLTNNCLWVVVLCSGWLWSHAEIAAGECVKRSPPHTVALLELYTSEGCSSCPPVDRWLSHIDRLGLTPDHVVPLSMHVDYWDSLGWRDRFASPVFTERQQALAKQALSNFVYTPEIFVSGKEFRLGSDSALLHHIDAINKKPALASIEMTLQPINDGVLPIQIGINLQSTLSHHRHVAYIAIYENGLTNQVVAGENRGVTLHHDHVVRRWIGPISISGTTKNYRTSLKTDATWITTSLGIAAFVEDVMNGSVIQTIDMPMCS